MSKRRRGGCPGRANDTTGAGGQALAELAVVVALMMVMALAVFDLSLGFFNGALVVQGARDGARVAMDCSRTISDIQVAALAVAPSGATAAVVPNPRPTCPASLSSDSSTAVTVNFTHQWVLPVWSGGNSTLISETATSR